MSSNVSQALEELPNGWNVQLTVHIVNLPMYKVCGACFHNSRWGLLQCVPTHVEACYNVCQLKLRLATMCATWLEVYDSYIMMCRIGGLAAAGFTETARLSGRVSVCLGAAVTAGLALLLYLQRVQLASFFTQDQNVLDLMAMIALPAAVAVVRRSMFSCKDSSTINPCLLTNESRRTQPVYKTSLFSWNAKRPGGMQKHGVLWCQTGPHDVTLQPMGGNWVPVTCSWGFWGFSVWLWASWTGYFWEVWTKIPQQDRTRRAFPLYLKCSRLDGSFLGYSEELQRAHHQKFDNMQFRRKNVVTLTFTPWQCKFLAILGCTSKV